MILWGDDSLGKHIGWASLSQKCGCGLTDSDECLLCKAWRVIGIVCDAPCASKIRPGQRKPHNRAVSDLATGGPLGGDAHSKAQLDHFFDRLDRSQLDPVAQLCFGANEILLDKPERRALPAVENHPL